MKKRVFIKVSRERQKKKVEKINFASWNRRTPWKRYMSSKRIFHQKNEKTRFYKSLQRAWQQKSGNRRKNGPYSKNAISMQHKKNDRKQKIVKNGTVLGPNTLSEAPGDLRSRNLHPKSGPVASTFLVIRNQNWDLAFFRFFCFLFLSNFLFFWKNGAVFLCSWEYRDDDCGEKGKTEGKEESTSILIHLLTPDRPPLRPCLISSK